MEALLAASTSALGLRLTPAQLKQFEVYQRELLEWNRKINLTAITDPQSIQTKHFLDSLSCWLAMRDTPLSNVVDVGTGAGFPGIPLKVLIPSMRLTLVEATRKKADFCRHIVDRLRLSQVEVLQARAETLGHDPDHREKYDWAVARSVAELPTLLEYLLPLTRVGGQALAQKGENAPVEAHAADRALALLGGSLSKVIPVELPRVVETRYLVVIKKVVSTPAQFPRRPGIPAKRPLI